jgi:hypothetical protein
MNGNRSIRMAPSIVVEVWRYMVCKQNVSHKSEMAGPFSRSDTIINKTFTFLFSHSQNQKQHKTQQQKHGRVSMTFYSVTFYARKVMFRHFKYKLLALGIFTELRAFSLDDILQVPIFHSPEGNHLSSF